MKAKLYVILAMVMLLSLGLVSAAYDLEATSVAVQESNHVADQDLTIEMTITNVGADDFDVTGETVDVAVDYGDIAFDTVQLTENITAGDSVVVTFTHAYATDDTYSLNGIVTGMSADEDDTNDEVTADVVIENSAPVVDAIDDQTIIQEDTFSYTVSASDVDDDDVLEYSLATAPSGMTIDSVTGEISYTSAAAGSFNVVVSVSDGTDATTESFTLNVQQDKPELSFVETAIVVGGPNQERGEQIIVTFTIENTGTQTLSDITVSTQRKGSSNPLNEEYDPQVSIDNSDLAPGETRVGTLAITIPSDKDSQNQVIGEIKAVGTANELNVHGTIDIEMEAKSYLEIDEIEIEAPNDDSTLDDGETFSDLKEGDKVTMLITVKNLYSEDDEIEIEDVEVKIDGDESDWDIKESSSNEDISEDDEYTFELTFTIGDDLDEDNTDVVIEVFGTDAEEDFEHYDSWTIEFEINRPDEELTIRRAILSQEVVTCSARYVDLEVEVKNTGSKTLDDILIEVESSRSDLDFDERVFDEDELRSGKSIEEEFRIPLPEDLTTGFYTIDVTAYFDNDEESDDDTHQKTVLLEVVCDDPNDVGGEADEQEDTSKEDGSGSIVVDKETTPETTTPPAGTGGVVYGEEVSKAEIFRSSNAYLWVLGGIVIVLLLVVIGLLAKLARKS